LLLLFALSLLLLAAGLARVVTQLLVATMMAIVMVVDVDSAKFYVDFVVAVCVFVFVDPDARVVGVQGHAFD
jgi:hypothetical protein